MPGGRGAAGGSLLPSPPSPPPRRLLSPPPPVARAPAPPSARASVQRMPRARDPGRARDALTPTRGEPREEEAGKVGAGGPSALAVACFAAAAAASGWAWPPPPSLAAIALAPGHARPCPGSPTRPTAPSSSRPQGPECGVGGRWRASLTYTRREDSTTGEDYWTEDEPPSPRKWHEALVWLPQDYG